MRELSLHVLDVAENGITAGADFIEILIAIDRLSNFFRIAINDNGPGISPEVIQRVTDPFYTTRPIRRVGLGLALLKSAAERCQGTFTIECPPGGGTQITATFQNDHIDRAPLGDMAGTITTLIIGHPQVDFLYRHTVDNDDFTMDTRELKAELEGMLLTNPTVIRF